MKTIKLTRKELQRLWSISHIFEDKFASKEYLKHFFSDIGISTRYLEYMLWQLDTLYILSKHSSDLVWKGGTCIQSFLPYKFQRFSIDLDINTQLDQASLKQLFEKEINREIRGSKKEEIIENISFGTFHFHSEDKQIGSMNFTRIVPTKHGGEIIFRGKTKVIGAIQIRVQVNYKLAENLGFIAQEVIEKTPSLIPEKIINKKFTFPHESIADLLSDKIVTMAEIPGFHRGRYRIKDVYDIAALILTSKKEKDKGKILRKLDAYSDAWKTDVRTILKASMDGLANIKELNIEALGLRGSVGVLGFSEIILKWNKITEEVYNFLEALYNAS